MKSVSEVAKAAGISVRTLHYYDEIGLLRPTEVTEAGYRLYDDAALSRLQQILFFRELDVPLREVLAILDDPSFESDQALRRHRELLCLKRDRLEGLIRLVDQRLKGASAMSMKEFDQSPVEEARARYAQEARERWGGTEAYAESERRTAAYGPADWDEAGAEAESIFRALAARMDRPPESPEVQALVEDWRAHITRRYYACTPEILAGLGEMYVGDQRFTQNLDRYGDGLARFFRDAIRVYCENLKQ